MRPQPLMVPPFFFCSLGCTFFPKRAQVSQLDSNYRRAGLCTAVQAVSVLHRQSIQTTKNWGGGGEEAFCEKSGETYLKWLDSVVRTPKSSRESNTVPEICGCRLFQQFPRGASSVPKASDKLRFPFLGRSGRGSSHRTSERRQVERSYGQTLSFVVVTRGQCHRHIWSGSFSLWRNCYCCLRPNAAHNTVNSNLLCSVSCF